jgi:hypothetical protein
VLFIAGDGRSGSTLLARLLGQLPGWVSAGEVRFTWERGILGNRDCECGNSFAECTFWSEVCREAYGEDPAGIAALARQIAQADSEMLRLRSAAPALFAARRPLRWAQRNGHYAETISAIYPAISSVADAGVVIDSSKVPAYGLLLRGLPELDVRVVHLVRDARASAYSWQQVRPLTDGADRASMTRRGVVRSSAVWQASNSLARRLLGRPRGAYLTVRYEDLVAYPTGTLRSIADFMGAGDVPLPVLGDRIQIQPGHAAAGNPNRFNHSPTTLRLDDQWRTQMSRSQSLLVTSLTLPMLKAYGYPVTQRSSLVPPVQGRV